MRVHLQLSNRRSLAAGRQRRVALVRKRRGGGPLVAADYPERHRRTVRALHGVADPARLRRRQPDVPRHVLLRGARHVSPLTARRATPSVSRDVRAARPAPVGEENVARPARVRCAPGPYVVSQRERHVRINQHRVLHGAARAHAHRERIAADRIRHRHRSARRVRRNRRIDRRKHLPATINLRDIRCRAAHHERRTSRQPEHQIARRRTRRGTQLPLRINPRHRRLKQKIRVLRSVRIEHAIADNCPSLRAGVAVSQSDAKRQRHSATSRRGKRERHRSPRRRKAATGSSAL